jgi:predicted O-methyltransferase YrrM
VTIEDLGAGSAKMPVKERSISDIARFSSTSPKYGRLLQNIVAYLKPATVIELGTCLGLGTLYMASAAKDTKVYTIEGSKTLHQKTKENFASLSMNNIISLQGNFDDLLPVLLKENGKFDLIFIDGNHKKEATIKYLQLCMPYAHPNSVVIFDDIRWSDDMQEAWREICRNEKVNLTLDLFKMGVVFFNDKIIKQNFELYY